MKSDAISIVEAAYDYEGDERTWFRRLVEHAAPRFDRGFGVAVSRYAPGMHPEEALIETCGMKGAFIDASNAMMSAKPEPFHRILSPEGGALNSVSQFLARKAEDADAWASFGEFMHPFGVRDVVGVSIRRPVPPPAGAAAPADIEAATPLRPSRAPAQPSRRQA